MELLIIVVVVVVVVVVVLWLLIAGFNMWVGVEKAGYSAAEELPILLLNSGVPAAVVALLKWKVF